MYVKSCPEIYAHISEHKGGAAAAGAIKRALAKRIRPKQVEIKDDSSDKTLGFAFRAKYNFCVMIIRDIRDNNSKNSHWSFFLKIGQGMRDKSNSEIMDIATQEKSFLSLPYNYIYPVENTGTVPALQAESGKLKVYVICENAPASDLGRVLAELAAETYIKTIDNREGHSFQVSTEYFQYGHPYH